MQAILIAQDFFLVPNLDWVNLETQINFSMLPLCEVKPVTSSPSDGPAGHCAALHYPYTAC